MSTYVFVGPTLPVAEARQHLDAIYLPPAAQGDIASLLRRQPRIIGIVDGYFESVPSIWHKEILLALSQGVRVVGAASLGALRAAELARYGMIGIGEIFQWYRDQVIDADDEVAIRHAPAEHGYRAASDALVNMRKTFDVARAQAIISAATAQALVRIGRQMHYTDRLYGSVLDRGAAEGLPAEELTALGAFLQDHRVDQKKLDAIALLQHIAGLETREAAPGIAFALQYTARLDELMDRDVRIDLDGDVRLTPDMLIAHSASRPDARAQLEDRATTTRLILNLAEQLGVRVGESEFDAGMKDFRASLGLSTDDDVTEWMRRNHLTAAERDHLVTEWLLVRKMKTLFRPDNRDLIRQLRWEGTFEEAHAAAVAESRATGPGNT
jgi:hypothetical protein